MSSEPGVGRFHKAADHGSLEFDASKRRCIANADSKKPEDYGSSMVDSGQKLFFFGPKNKNENQVNRPRLMDPTRRKWHYGTLAFRHYRQTLPETGDMCRKFIERPSRFGSECPVDIIPVFTPRDENTQRVSSFLLARSPHTCLSTQQ